MEHKGVAETLDTSEAKPAHRHAPGSAGPTQIFTGIDARGVIGTLVETHIAVEHLGASVGEVFDLAGRQVNDQAAIVGERHFARRFGFRAKLPARTAVIKIKDDYNLDDFEVRLVKLAGALRVTETGAYPRPSVFLVVFGWLQLAVISCIGMVAITSLIWVAPTSLSAIGKLLGVALVSSGVASLTYFCFIKANRLMDPSRRNRFKIQHQDSESQ